MDGQPAIQTASQPDSQTVSQPDRQTDRQSDSQNEVIHRSCFLPYRSKVSNNDKNKIEIMMTDYAQMADCLPQLSGIYHTTGLRVTCLMSVVENDQRWVYS